MKRSKTMSEILDKARAYEEKYDDFIRDDDRPGYHLTPRVGWMNDPNGFCYYKGQYHLFYQYHPYSTKWGPMHWGHVVSDDLVRWRYLPAALAPDRPYDKDGCFSGSAVELDDGRHLIMYTGDRCERRSDGSTRVIQTQCLALGDGLDYEKCDVNPVLTASDLPEGFSEADFRDPKLWREPDGSFACVVACRTGDGSGAVLLYRSDDAMHWRFADVLDRCYNEYGRMWECPDFFRLGGKQVLLACPQEMSPLGLEFANGHHSMALIGSWDGQRFTREQVQSMDYGLDFYAPQTTLSPDGRRLLVAWLQNWDTCVSPDAARWFGQMGTVRELGMRDGRLIQNPVRELELLHGREVTYAGVPVSEESTLPGVYGRLVDLSVTVEPQETCYDIFRLKVAKGSQHYTSISYMPSSSTLRLSRSHAGINHDFVHERDCRVRSDGGRIKLRVLLDRFSVEVFVNDGEQALSAVIYTPLTSNGISFECCGDAVISVTKYDINV